MDINAEAEDETWKWRTFQGTNETPKEGCPESGCTCGTCRAEEVWEGEELPHLMTEEESAYFQNFNILVGDEEGPEAISDPVYWTT